MKFWGKGLVALLVLVLLVACGDDAGSSGDGPDSPSAEKRTLSGFVQKGPFLKGSRVSLQELDAALRVQPDLADAYLVKTQIYTALSDFDTAIENLDEYIKLTEDTDLYDRICTLLGVRVATYSSSPALSMIYRQQDDRFYFTARENLEVSLALL